MSRPRRERSVKRDAFWERLQFLLRRLRERLWVRPLAASIVSVLIVVAAKLAETTSLGHGWPRVSQSSIEALLSIMGASMLVIATFSVASMVSAYASAGGTATPRSFALIVADDASQNALSTFVGAFIFSIIGLTAVKNDYFRGSGLVVLFVFTALVFSFVILMFVRWVDRIARLGRLASTIDKVEAATSGALKRRREAPRLHGVPVAGPKAGVPVYASRVGYVQRVDVVALQQWAERANAHVRVEALPGTFAVPGRPLAYVRGASQDDAKEENGSVAEAFQIGGDRLFDDDPRFGLVVLSEIAGRALSPAVNDPGTAIDIVGTLIRLLSQWIVPLAADDQGLPKHTRVEVPTLSLRDMFDDAFTAIGRDGAPVVEVSVRLQKALLCLAEMGDAEMREAAEYHKLLALSRAEAVMKVEEDLAAVRQAGMPTR